MPPSTDYSVHLWNAGTDTPITGDGAFFGVRTDGTSVVYSQVSGGVESVKLFDGSSTTLLGEAPCTGRGSVRIAGGFAAYEECDASQATPIWRHSLAGEAQLTQLSSNSTIEQLAPDGTILFHNVLGRFVAVPGSQPERVGSQLGTTFYRDGKFLVALGTTVLQIVP